MGDTMETYSRGNPAVPAATPWAVATTTGRRARVRDPWSGGLHLLGAVLAALGLAYLLVAAGPDLGRRWASLVYGLSMMALFGASATYHLYNGGRERVLVTLHRLDQAAVYLLIAATFTPLCALVMPPGSGLLLLLAVWSIAAVGIPLRLLRGASHGRPLLTVTPYLVMGWLGVFVMVDLATRVSWGALAWMLAGGLFYTVGGAVFARRWPDPWPGVFGHHEIWHLFVLAGAAAHWVLMAFYVLPHRGV
jgi:hemolysin III